MLNSYIKTAWRNLQKQRFYTGLNILGLSLGIAGGMLLFQFIRYHLSFDRYHPKAAQLYRVVTELHLPDKSVVYDQGTPLDLTEALQNEVPQVKDQAVLLKVPRFTVGVSRVGEHKFFTEEGTIAFADQHWFNLFDYTWIAGNAATSLIAPNTAVITQRLAGKYFGNEDPVGKTINLDDKYPVTITGILDDYPGNTDLKLDMFISRASFRAFYPDLDNDMLMHWSTINSTTQSFVWLPDGTSGRKTEVAMERLRDQHFEKDIASSYQFRLQAVKDMHFDARYGGTMQLSLLVTLAIVGSFLILIACFNFINLATAQSTKRAREVGTRKVLGSTDTSIFWQFITETACMVLVAAALSLFWIALTLPVFHRWMQTQLPFNLLHDWRLLLFLFLLIGLVTLMAGFYPALILSRWKPINALKQQASGVRSVFFRKGLIITQQVVVQVLIICTIVITLQIKYIKSADPGFHKDEVLMIPIPDPDNSKLSLLGDRLKGEPSVQSVSFCLQAPLSQVYMGGSVKYDSRPWEDFEGRTILGDANYVNTFQLQLLAGRNLQQSDTAREFLINETFLHKLGLSDPQQVIGHQLVAGQLNDHSGTIAGVVKDFNVHPLHTSIEPVLITCERSRYRYAAIKLHGAQHGQIRDAIQKAWQAVYPTNVFDYHYLNEEIDAYYHKEDLLSKLINTTAAIAIIISCLGLLGLISFFAVQRTKEIGIRKVLGATVSEIVYLLSKDLLKMIAASMVIAVPAAWYFMNGWLHNFAYRLPISWWIFVLAGLLSAFIALCTVGYQAVKTALTNPVESLRSE
ncbi:MAG TPA: FtsX-like permease family protein [Niastella sp.]